LQGLLSDQYRRGRLRASLSGSAPWQAVSAGQAVLDAPAGIWRAARPGSPFRFRQLAGLAPFLMAGALATAAGTVRGGLPRDGAAERAVNRHRTLRLQRGLEVLRRPFGRR
jgi:hypothetical protein